VKKAMAFFVRIAAVLVAAGSLAVSAAAQENPPPKKFGPRAQSAGQAAAAVAPTVVATHGDWKIQCETAAQQTDGAQPPQKQCGMIQTARNEKNPKVSLTLVLVKAKQGDKSVTMMRVMAPIGVFLPTGVALEIDGGAVGRVPFTRCLPQVCMAFAEASAETLTKLRKGGGANFIIYEAPGLGLPMKISLSGFSAALAELEKL
jgi:invasion protein IalB